MVHLVTLTINFYSILAYLWESLARIKFNLSKGFMSKPGNKVIKRFKNAGNMLIRILVHTYIHISFFDIELDKH